MHADLYIPFNIFVAPKVRRKINKNRSKRTVFEVILAQFYLDSTIY